MKTAIMTQEEIDQQRTKCKELFEMFCTYKNPSFWQCWKKAFDLGADWQRRKETTNTTELVDKE